MPVLLKVAYVKSYWAYYLSLERRFARTEEYVAIDEANDKAYSIEYLALMQAICSEVDRRRVACRRVRAWLASASVMGA